MIDFDLKYAQIHSQIQQDSQLVSVIYDTAKRCCLNEKTEKYVHLGRIGEIYLGLDLNNGHINMSFGDIVAKMRLLYELSGGNADLSRVYTKLENYLGIVSEDVSYGTGLFVDNRELERTTFWVQVGESVRKPIIDLDHEHDLRFQIRGI